MRADEIQQMIIQQADCLPHPAAGNIGQIGFQETEIETQVGIGNHVATLAAFLRPAHGGWYLPLHVAQFL
jgi:hypothetical protein